MDRAKLRQIYNILDGKSQATASAYDTYKQSLLEAEQKLKQAMKAANLDEVSNVVKDLHLLPLIQELKKFQTFYDQITQTTNAEIGSKLKELQDLGDKADQDINSALEAKISLLVQDITGLQGGLSSQTDKVTGLVKSLGDLGKKFKTLADLKNEFDTFKAQDAKTDAESLALIEKEIKKVRTELMMALQTLQNRGGSMNRQIFIGGNNPLTKYTDINLKAGANVTLSYVDNNTTKKVDITIASSGGGGSVGGTVRQIQTLTVSSTIGTVTGTDQVYLANGGLTITMPDATSGDTNLYTIKNIGVSSVLINTVSAQTIDGQPTVIMPVRYTSIDLVSDSANWEIT